MNRLKWLFIYDSIFFVWQDAVLGGTGTTTSTVEWTIAELLKHPNTLNKVQQELTKVVGLNNKVEESHLPKLTYLNAVIKETLRLHPSAPLLIPRAPSQSTTIGGYKIPQGTKIFVNIWGLQRDPSVWDNPLEFAPERFLVNSDASSYQKFNLNSGSGEFNYLPFGSGRRACPGIPLANKLVPYMVATFLHLFDWKLPHGTELEFSDKFGIVAMKRVPLVAVPTFRSSDPELYSMAWTMTIKNVAKLSCQLAIFTSISWINLIF